MHPSRRGCCTQRSRNATGWTRPPHLSRRPSSAGVSTFTVANTMASLPFIFLIAVVSTVCVYWLADLRPGAGYVW